MKYRIILISSALAALLSAPGVADAHRVSSSQSVRAHLSAADRAIGRFDVAVESNADARAETALVRNRRQMRAASRETARLRRAARGVSGAKRVAAATTRVGLQADTNAGVLAEAVASVDGGLQADVAGDLSSNLLTGLGALGVLTQLTDGLPGRAQAAAVEAIGRLTQIQGVLGALTGSIDADQVTAAVRQSLTTSLALAIQTMDAGIEALNSLRGTVTAMAVPVVQQALAIATQQLPSLAQSLERLAGSGIPGLPRLDGGSGSVQVGIDGSLSSVSVSGLCGLVPALPVPLPVPVC